MAMVMALYGFFLFLSFPSRQIDTILTEKIFRLVSEPPRGPGEAGRDEGDGEALLRGGRRHGEPHPRHHHPAAADPR